MGFNRFTKNVLNISGLPDRVQNQATTLKALFDQAGVDIKEALNALMTELEANTAADSIGADVGSVATKTVQAILTAYEGAIADRYTKLESDTMLSENTNNLVADLDVNLTTGVITVTKKDGTTETFDTAIEKVPAKFEIVETNGKYALKITNVDGTSTQTDITNLMNLYTFNNSDTINFAVTGEGNEKTVVANIKANSIGLDKLSLTVVSTLEGYMNSARDSANAAKISENNAKSAANTATKAAETASAGAEAGRVAVQKATEAESYAHGGTGTRPGEDTDNAKYYSEIAKEVAGGDFVTTGEMEAYAQPLGTTPTYETTELSGQEIEVDAPLNIESILHLSGNSEQDSRSGKNLYDYKDMVQSISGLTNVINADGTVTTTGTPTASYASIIPGLNITDLLEDGEIYTVAQSTAVTQDIYIQISLKRADNGVVEYINTKKTKGKSATFVVDKTTYQRYDINVQIGADVTTNRNFTSGYMLLKGSYTDDTLPEFEPYGVQPSPEFKSEIRSVSGDVEVKVEGKNIVDFASGTPSTTKNTYTFINDVFVLGGTDSWTAVTFNLLDIARANVGKTLKFYYEDYDFSNGNKPIINYVYDIGAGAVYKSAMHEGKVGQLTIPNNLTRMELKIMSNNTSTAMTTSISITKPMLYFVETGEATTYQPYGDETISLPLGDIELCSTPDGTRDTFERVDGVWNKVEYAPSVIFDGVNVKFESKSGSTANTIWMSQAIYPVKDFAVIMSNRFKGVEKTLFYSDQIGAYTENNRIKVAFGLNSELTTLELANNWLVNNPIEVQYPTTTPTYTPITDPALISALDELEQLVLHKGYNKITATSANGVKAELDLSIPSTASVTEVVETEANLDMLVLVASGEGDVKPKVTNKMTVNPATGEVKINGGNLSTVTHLTSTIPTTGWTTSAPYYVDINISEMLATDYPHITPAYTGVEDTDNAIQEAWNKINRAVAKSNALRVYAAEIPTTAIPVQIEVVR